VDTSKPINPDGANLASMKINQEHLEFERPFPSNIEIGRRMRIARKKRGWTIAEMATAGQINAVVIGSYERGSRNMPISRLGEIARILGVDVAYLLGQPTIVKSESQVLTIDLRAISRVTFTNPDWLVLLVRYCAGIAKKRSDWNGEILSIRESDLTDLGFAIGVDPTVLLRWLVSEKYLFTETSHS